MASNNSNYNKISVKTDSMVEMIEQLSKLGVFKEKRKKRAKRTTAPGDIRQDNDMIASVTTLEGEPGRGDPNLFALRQIEPGMSEQQIADIQERNNAGIAALRAEVQQQRLEDLREQERFIGDLATAAAGRFGQLESGLANIQSGKFGASSEPMRQSSAILLPDIQEETFTQTLNEGGPQAKPAVQTEFFAEGEEEEGIPTSGVGGGGGAPLQPIPKIQRGKPTRKQFLELNGLGNIPPNTKNTTPQTMRNYYEDFSQVFGFDADESLFRNKDGMYKDMVRKIDDLINLSV